MLNVTDSADSNFAMKQPLGRASVDYTERCGFILDQVEGPAESRRLDLGSAAHLSTSAL